MNIGVSAEQRAVTEAQKLWAVIEHETKLSEKIYLDEAHKYESEKGKWIVYAADKCWGCYDDEEKAKRIGAQKAEEHEKRASLVFQIGSYGESTELPVLIDGEKRINHMTGAYFRPHLPKAFVATDSGQEIDSAVFHKIESVVLNTGAALWMEFPIPPRITTIDGKCEYPFALYPKFHQPSSSRIDVCIVIRHSLLHNDDEYLFSLTFAGLFTIFDTTIVRTNFDMQLNEDVAPCDYFRDCDGSFFTKPKTPASTYFPMGSFMHQYRFAHQDEHLKPHALETQELILKLVQEERDKLLGCVLKPAKK